MITETIRKLQRANIRIEIAGDKIRLHGDNPPDQVSMECLKKYKPQIMALVKRLPAECPLLTAHVVNGCRFDLSLLKRLMDEGTLTIETGCPLISVCKLVSREEVLQ